MPCPCADSKHTHAESQPNIRVPSNASKLVYLSCFRCIAADEVNLCCQETQQQHNMYMYMYMLYMHMYMYMLCTCVVVVVVIVVVHTHVGKQARPEKPVDNCRVGHMDAFCNQPV